MAEQKILCSVKSCYYNEAGDVCLASEIKVINNPAASLLGMEIGAIGQADKTGDTACQTFIPQEEGPKPGIEKIHR